MWTYKKKLLCIALLAVAVLSDRAVANEAANTAVGGKMALQAARSLNASPSARQMAPADLCRQATQTAERVQRLPAHLLTAISLAESGRQAEAGHMHAWPWTVMAEGKGRYYTTKEHAIAEVEVLLSQGVKNIDVGCMQVNLHFHWDAFETLDDAFDPASNVAYAAGFLKQNYEETRSWTAAAGQYHSRTPEKSKPYRLKVIRLWNEVRREKNGEALATVSPKTGHGTTQLDPDRTKRLNASLRERRAREREDQKNMTLAERRTSELLDWRRTRNRGLRLEAVVARRFAELEQNRKQRLRSLETVDQRLSFAERRRQQLDKWRQTGDLGVR